MSNYLLWQLLSNGVFDPTEFSKIKTGEIKIKTTNNYPKYTDSVVRPNTIGRAKGHRKNKAHMN